LGFVLASDPAVTRLEAARQQKSPYHMTKSFITKSLLGASTITALAILPAFGAGSGSINPPAIKPPANQGFPQVKQENPAIKAYNEGVDLMKAKKFAQAQAKFEQALKADPKLAEAHNNLAFVLRKQGSQNYQVSLEHYNKAIQLKPNLAEAYMYRGVLYTQMGRKAEAQADLAKLQKMNPHLAKELEEFIKTGKEDDELYGAAKKVSS
jgi:tetratricopeptide (TPR) repeat protein